MLALLLALALTPVLARGEVRRTVADVADAADTRLRVLLLRGSRTPRSLGLVLGVLAAGELLLEVPPLRGAWWVVAPAAVFTVRLAVVALWARTTGPASARLAAAIGARVRPVGVVVRTWAVFRLPSHAFAAVVGLLLHEDAGLVALAAALAGYVALMAVLTPLLLRLTLETRPPGPDEAARVAQVAAAHGVPVGGFRVVADDGISGSNAVVSGVGRGARLLLSEPLLAYPDDELAAILAHEAVHRDRHHLPWRAVLRVVVALAATALCLLALAVAGEHLLALAVVVVVAVAAPPLTSAAAGCVTVAQEYAADAGAAARVGPGAVRRALERIARDNQLPRSYSTWRSWLVGHPPLEARLARLDGSAPSSSSSHA